ncbi:hypothetical protein [Streptomyces sp. NPDC057854]|uniref:hypothetical protein n=1 Tax=unclassified Streptomyces TaxID=2593676 RepID=UPI00368FCDEC
MTYSHIAIGLDSLGAVRVDILWTPGEGDLELVVRDRETLVEYGVWRALVELPHTPDAAVLHAVIRSMLGVLSERTIWAAYVYDLAGRNGFNWVPEKLAA